MIITDFVILAIVTLSVIVSVVRGFVKEALSLLVWLLAIWVSFKYAGVVDEKLVDTITSPAVRLISSFAILFVPILLVGALINRLVSGVIKSSGLGGPDRALGLVFGGARGVLIIAVFVSLASSSAVPKGKWWDDSKLLVHFQGVAVWLKKQLPEKIQIKRPTQTSNTHIESQISYRNPTYK